MKNALIIGGLSIALVVGGGVVYTFMSAQKDPAIITKKTADPTPVSYTHLKLPTIYSV